MYEFKLKESDPFYSNLPEYINWEIWECVNSDDPIRLFAEDNFSPDLSVWSRNPYYHMRGKPVTCEQAFDIYTKTNALFSDVLCMDGSVHFYLFPRGWIHPCGEVWQNSCFEYKWATLREMAYDFIPIAYNFSFLDMITVVTYWNGEPPEDFVEENHALRYFKYGKKDCSFLKEEPYNANNFFDRIEMGIWVHDKMIEFISPEKTARLYSEYNKFYKDKRPSDFEENRTLMEKCFKAYGIENMEEYFGKRWNELHGDDNEHFIFLGHEYGK